MAVTLELSPISTGPRLNEMGSLVAFLMAASCPFFLSMVIDMSPPFKTKVESVVRTDVDAVSFKLTMPLSNSAFNLIFQTQEYKRLLNGSNAESTSASRLFQLAGRSR